jgi:SAM-dependent methyltransferase
VDISAEAIRSAGRDHGANGAKFEVGDALSLDYESTFDCVFARGLSSYNVTELEQTRSVTDKLLSYLKPGGVMIFGYHTNLNPQKEKGSWHYHSFANAKRYFSSYPGAKTYFTLRVETLLFGRYAFYSPLQSLLSAFISRSTGIGGELVAFIPRPVLRNPSESNPRTSTALPKP